MKPGNILLATFLIPALSCSAQDKAPAAPGTTTPLAQDTTNPVAQGAVTPGMTDNYIIGETDVITVSVLKEPTLSNSMPVRPDGMISVPLLGDVKAAGKTPMQLADDITTKLKTYIQDPNVIIILTQMISKKVYLIGEFGKPGPMEMTPGMTLLQAIASAGGFGPFANVKKTYILRNDGGKLQKIPVHYKKALRGDSSLNLTLYPGDTIVVP
jgi:polysaccharide export outer membrane protein